MLANYGSIGPYPKSGYWLVEKGGASALVRGDHLPKEGQGFRYYFLGSNEAKVKERWQGAIGAFGFDVGNVQYSKQTFTEAKGKGVSSNVTNPGGFSFANALVYGAAGVGGVALTAGRAAAAAGTDAAAGGAAGAEGAAGGAAGGTAATAASKTLSSALGEAGLIGAAGLLVGAYGTRLLEILAGGALILFALMTLARGGKAPSAIPVPIP